VRVGVRVVSGGGVVKRWVWLGMVESGVCGRGQSGWVWDG